MEDRNGTLTKAYISKAGGSARAIVAGEMWDDVSCYRFGWFQDSATVFGQL